MVNQFYLLFEFQGRNSDGAWVANRCPNHPQWSVAVGYTFEVTLDEKFKNEEIPENKGHTSKSAAFK
ncbi:MAG: hypothetical protein IT395_00040 [Candidatus Omnitrophica bacterium]|nr:hypothetical protein [Candidatus Omnitrophota bacterium]